MRVHVELAHNLHPLDWAARNARREVPDKWPYGLDRLANYGVEPTFRTPIRGRAVERIARAVRAKGGGFEWLDAAVSLPRLARRQADAILCWEEQTAVPAIFRERAAPGGKPVVTGIIWLTDGDAVPPLAARLARRVLPYAQAIWVASNRQILPLTRDWGVQASRVHYIPLGIETRFFRPASPDVAESGLVVSAGNDRHRDHAMLVEAVTQVRRRVGAARVEIATRQPVVIDGELGARRVGFTERDVAALYGRASIVAVSTVPNVHASGLTVALEAMASARPVVVPSDTGLADYVVSGETGMLYRSGDVTSLTAAIEQLLTEPKAAAAMGVAARRRVEAHYTTEAQATRLADLLKSI